MILGIGIDLVEIARFEPWTAYSTERLLRVFTTAELADCRNKNGSLITEKLATRYAAKEAFYKAISASLVNLKLTQREFGLLSLAPLVEVTHSQLGGPILQINWYEVAILVGQQVPAIGIHLSLSHERTTAVAMVVIENT